jgi:pimeloyl-ACP methyl ester carboxylesterase
VLHAPTGISAYDFSFDRMIACRRPWQRPERIEAVARFGAAPSYPDTWERLESQGIALVNNPAQHRRASELTEWYPLIADWTPRSIWFSACPSASEVARTFDWPVFVKGSRQTSRHQANLSIARSAAEFDRIMERYREDDILSWQTIVCREFVDLRPVRGETGDKVSPAFEFRTFWWRGQLVGSGRYWSEYCDYSWSPEEKESALRMAAAAASVVDVPFLVVDVAQMANGQWIVIECNDGQESGYAGVSPFSMWRAILELEKAKGKPFPEQPNAE